MTKLYGKDALEQTLRETAKKNRLSHAIMFSGRKGAGKKVMARFTARLFLCGNNACGECVNCRNIDSGIHPDVIFVKETLGGKYSMETLKPLLQGTAVKPNNGELKIYVFEDCDTMLAQHQNTLLKLIEEPAPHLRFIFTCENTNLVPITVMSRVTLYEVPDTDPESCVRCLVEDGADQNRAAELARIFSGNIGQCRAVLSENENETRLFEIAKKAALAVAERNGYAAAAALSEAKERADLSAVFGFLAQFFRDALALKIGAECEFSEKNTARKIAESYSEEELLAILDAVYEISANDIYNIKPELTAAYFTTFFAG